MPGAPRWLARRLACWGRLGLLALLCAGSLPAVPPSAPARPKSPAAKPSPPAANNDVSLPELTAKLGLKATWNPSGKTVSLTDGTRRLEMTAESREAKVNGLRVFLGSPATMRRGLLQVSRTDFDTCLLPLLRPSLIGTRLARPKIIVLDPGHGGADQGTGNARLGYKEKVFTLDVAGRLKKLLESKGYHVVLTRTADERLDLPSRAVIANRANADLFVSIHFNALPNDQKTRGTEVFTFAPRSQRSTNSWGPTEADDTEHEPAPANRFDAWNSLAAHALHRELLAGLGSFDRGKKIGHLGVLRGLNCPGVLVESGFLSHDEEARLIATPDYRQRIAVALAKGIQDYAAQVESLRRKP